MSCVSELKLIINRILSGKTSDLCRLCLKIKTDDFFTFSDTVVLAKDEGEEIKPLSDVLNIVCNLGIHRDETELNCICSHCAHSAIDMYVFLQQCRAASIQLNKVLAMLSLGLSFKSLKKRQKPLSMYVILKKDTTRVIMDMQLTKSSSEASRRINTLLAFEKCKVTKQKQIIRYKSNNYQCPDCKKYHTSQWHLDKHIKTHKKIKCNICDKLFTTDHKLITHNARFHSAKIFKCPECPRKYGSQELVEEHKSQSHSGCVYKCRPCGKSYTNKRSLHAHLESHKPKICQGCNKTYRLKENYLNHVKQCGSGKIVGTKQFACNVCVKAFSHKNTLQVHMKFEHGDEEGHVCKWCQKKFSAYSRLKAHIVKHTRERKYKCDYCSGVFVTREALIYHTRRHTGEKPYQCHLCPEKFLSASRRMNHIRKVHIGPELKCDICNSKFLFPATLKHHRLKHFNTKKLIEKGKDLKEIHGDENVDEEKDLKEIHGDENVNEEMVFGQVDQKPDIGAEIVQE